VKSKNTKVRTIKQVLPQNRTIAQTQNFSLLFEFEMSHFFRVLGSGKSVQTGDLLFGSQIVISMSHFILKIVTFQRSIQMHCTCITLAWQTIWRT
jgi:hypothetical protein